MAQDGSGRGELSKTVVLNVVALTQGLIHEEYTPNIWRFCKEKKLSRAVIPPFPAVTCVSQATYLSGKPPSEHGVTGNGYYDSRLKQIFNWHQSAGNVQTERLYAQVKREDPNATVFVHTWWHSMYEDDIDYLVMCKPEYRSDGRKLPDSYTKPGKLRDHLHEKFGKYPLHRFWGPMTSIESSRWIANTAMEIDSRHNPTLSLIYLPHLDYSLQKYGPGIDQEHVQRDLREIDAVVGDLLQHYKARGAAIIILSEYGIAPVHAAVHINRALRSAGYLDLRAERLGYTLDCGASAAFAHPDHQVAHVHVHREGDIAPVRKLLQELDGVDEVLTAKEMPDVYHKGRCGDLLVVAKDGYWFTYYFWEKDSDAPDYARCVAIHDKPGYDPTEMFFRQKSQLLGAMYLVFKASLSMLVGIRTLVDATPLDRADEIRGSHGRRTTKDPRYMPVLAGAEAMQALGSTSEEGTALRASTALEPTLVREVILGVLRRDQPTEKSS